VANRVLTREFFDRGADAVASDLVGCVMAVRDADRVQYARLVETEAYGGLDDPASHAFRGPTPRSSIMFGPSGFLYVYRIYGLHWCMNVVTGPAGVAGAVLLRAAELSDELGHAVGDSDRRLRGPGNLTRGLGVAGADNGVDCCSPDGRLSLYPRDSIAELVIGRTTRVGVTRERDRRSRYFLEGHDAVSAHPRKLTDDAT
jgi:DNA-3-methyladenine glycosylase